MHEMKSRRQKDASQFSGLLVIDARVKKTQNKTKAEK